MRKQRGVTLIELMVTMVIIGILTSIAVPAYTAHIIQGKIAAATGALAEGKVRMEQNFNTIRKYYVDDTSTNCPNLSALFADTAFDVSVACTATTFTLTATGEAADGMDGYTYTINQSGEKTSKTPSVGAAQPCWLKSRAQTSC